MSEARHFIIILIVVSLACIVSQSYISVRASSTIRPFGETSISQLQFIQIIVNGTVVTGPNSVAHRRDGRIMIPVAAVARALGDIVEIDRSTRTVTIQQQSRNHIIFDARIGQVRENGSSILTVSNAGEIVFSPNPAELLLPAEIAASMFDVSIRFDADRNAVLVTRGLQGAEPLQKKIDQGFADIYQLDYDYGLNRYVGGSSQNLLLSAVGRLADGRFSLSSNSTAPTGKGLSIRNWSFALERPNSQRFEAGDFGAASNLQLMSTVVRGGSLKVPVGRAIVTAFGGRSLSGFLPAENDTAISNNHKIFRYDTTIAGVSAASNPFRSGKKADTLNFAAGAMSFGSANRRGNLVTGNLNYDISRFRVQADVGYGKFQGLQPSGQRFDASGAAVDVAGTFQLTSDLAFQARYTNIGKHFFAPQSGVREPIEIKAAGGTWSPLRWLSTSFNASLARRPGTSMQNSQFASGAVAITPARGFPRIYVSHTQSRTSLIPAAAFTMINASREFQKIRFYLNASRIKNVGAAAANVQVGASYALNDRNSFEVSQGVGSRKSMNGQFDWRATNFLPGLSFTAGAGYYAGANAKISAFERLSASLSLPRQMSLQVNYYNTNSGATVFVSLKGSLFRRREAAAFLDSLPAEMNATGIVSGRVYQDIDQNGKFDATIDRPQPNVKIRVDGNRYVVSDENGQYKFESVTAGDHKVYIDLLSIRADLTLLGDTIRDTHLKPGHDSIYDFRLIRTGKISGRVWLDINENGKYDDGETPLADVRVVTASGRDTLTDENGYFVIGDLIPGEHIFLLDEKTLPEKTMSEFKPIAVQAFPGRETGDVWLPVIAIPAEVKRFPAKPAF